MCFDSTVSEIDLNRSVDRWLVQVAPEAPRQQRVERDGDHRQERTPITRRKADSGYDERRSEDCEKHLKSRSVAAMNASVSSRMILSMLLRSAPSQYHCMSDRCRSSQA